VVEAPSLQDRDLATAAVSCVAWQGGASILRVHDVRSTKIACDTFVALSK
jgi:dihydropteroate synthase